MATLTRKEYEAIYKMFDEFTLGDQRNFYKSTVDRYRRAASQVNMYRAVFSLLTGFASALAGLIVQSAFLSAPGNAQPNCTIGEPSCQILSGIVIVLMITAVVAPVIGGAFGTLADLYQWDRLITVYSTALENIEVADARSPDMEEDDLMYRASLVAYAEGTMQVMKDEASQWGQLIRTPAQLEKFLQDELDRAAKAMDNESSNGGNAPVTPANPPAAPQSTNTPPQPPVTDGAVG